MEDKTTRPIRGSETQRVTPTAARMRTAIASLWLVGMVVLTARESSAAPAIARATSGPTDAIAAAVAAPHDETAIAERPLTAADRIGLARRLEREAATHRRLAAAEYRRRAARYLRTAATDRKKALTHTRLARSYQRLAQQVVRRGASRS